MAQLSRPFMIVIGAVCVLAVALFALQGQLKSSSSSPSSTASAPATKAPAAPATVHKQRSLGNAPGLKGLSHAIKQANGAAATSQRYNHQLEAKSAQASGEATRGANAGSSAQPSSTTSAPSSSTSTSASAAHPTVKKPSSASPAAAKGIPARETAVEDALHQGKVAVILFWNPKGADDRAVNTELKLLEAVHHLVRPIANVPRVRATLQRLGLELQKPFAAFRAKASEVTSFGSITQDVQVGATPTLLIVNKNGQTIELNGLQDALSIEQSIDETRNMHA